VNNNTLKSLPSLPSTSKQRPLRPCECGCGLTTQRMFAPGHDSKLKAVVLRVVAGVMDLNAVEAWGGLSRRKAVEATLANTERLTRWGIEIPEVEAEVEEAV